MGSWVDLVGVDFVNWSRGRTPFSQSASWAQHTLEYTSMHTFNPTLFSWIGLGTMLRLDTELVCSDIPFLIHGQPFALHVCLLSACHLSYSVLSYSASTALFRDDCHTIHSNVSRRINCSELFMLRVQVTKYPSIRMHAYNMTRPS